MPLIQLQMQGVHDASGVGDSFNFLCMARIGFVIFSLSTHSHLSLQRREHLFTLKQEQPYHNGITSSW